jgi:hypothetical protein
MPTPASSEKPQFMLLLHQPHGAGPGPTPDELKAIMVHFGKWMAGLRAKGAVLGTNGLAPAGKVLRGKRGASSTDGPYVEAKEIVGGYVLLQAADLDAAVEHARDCPGLDYGMTVEVRPVIAPGARA